MEIIELFGQPHYPDAHELPNKNRRWVNGRNKSSPSGNSASKKKNRMIIPGKMHAEILKASQEQTAANKKILVIAGGKRRWVLLKDWNEQEEKSSRGAGQGRSPDRAGAHQAQARA